MQYYYIVLKSHGFVFCWLSLGFVCFFACVFGVFGVVVAIVVSFV